MKDLLRAAVVAVLMFAAFVAGVGFGYMYGFYDASDQAVNQSVADKERRANDSQIMPAFFSATP